MNLKKFAASVFLGASLLTAPLLTAQDEKYFFSAGFGGYKWKAESLSRIFDDSLFAKAGFGVRLKDNFSCKFNAGYLYDKNTFPIGGGISETCEMDALYLEALLGYSIPFLENLEFNVNGGISVMSLENKIKASDGQTASEGDSSFGIPLSVGIDDYLFSKDFGLTMNLGINLNPFDGPIFSGNFYNFGIKYNF